MTKNYIGGVSLRFSIQEMISDTQEDMFSQNHLDWRLIFNALDSYLQGSHDKGVKNHIVSYVQFKYTLEDLCVELYDHLILKVSKI